MSAHVRVMRDPIETTRSWEPWWWVCESAECQAEREGVADGEFKGSRTHAEALAAACEHVRKAPR